MKKQTQTPAVLAVNRKVNQDDPRVDVANGIQNALVLFHQSMILPVKRTRVHTCQLVIAA